MGQIIECIPNFSEGNDYSVIQQITETIEMIDGARLLNVDPGKDANRTVVTFAGNPEAVIEAAFQAIKKAGELIDMRRQKGKHPRIGATDVCPLVPIANISLEETIAYAIKLAKRVGTELNIPVYLYEAAQPDKGRSNLSVIRKGEYEGFFEKIKDPFWKPDFGPSEFDAKRGATVIGARNFLVAFNINLDTSSVAIAKEIAAEIRESGRVVSEKNKTIKIPGKLKNLKAIGWYMPEYGLAQVSMNFTDINSTPVHIAYEEACRIALSKGTRVTGSELIGMIPLQCLTEAGRFFLQKENRTGDFSDQDLVAKAVQSLGLDQLSPFYPKERVIEWVL